jgi:6-phosphogluconate dehydrogenase
VRRTQLYLDDDLWTTLHTNALRQGTTVSSLVREAVRERYLGKLDERRKAMETFVGLRRSSAGQKAAVEIVRDLRTGHRIEMLRDE